MKVITQISLASTIAVSTLAINATLNIGANKAYASSLHRIVTVPFTWKLEQTTGPQRNNASISIENNGPTGNIAPDSESLAGSFTITAYHTPPSNFKERLDPLPETINLVVQGQVTGMFANTTFDATILGVPIDTYIRVNPSLSLSSGNFPAFGTLGSETGPGSGEINQTLSSSPISVGDGDTISYSGDINGSVLFGAGFENVNVATVFSQLLVSGNFDGQTEFDIRYKVPEPLTILGVSTAAGFGAFFKRKLAKKNEAEKA